MVEQSPRIDLASQTQIPDSIMKRFEGKSSLFILRKDYKPGNFSAFYIIQYSSGERTYVAKQTKTYFTDGDTEELIYLIDVDKSGIEEGRGEIRMNISSDNTYFKNKPFVGYTQTESDFQRQGLGTRRLHVMNEFTKRLYGLSLHSGTNIGDEAKRLWERLVKQGEAVKYIEGQHDRFRFI